MLDETRLSFTFAADNGYYEEGVLYFYERNPENDRKGHASSNGGKQEDTDILGKQSP